MRMYDALDARERRILRRLRLPLANLVTAITAITLLACGRVEQSTLQIEEKTKAGPGSPATAYSHAVEVSGSSIARSITGAEQATLRSEDDRTIVAASGADPRLGLRIAAPPETQFALLLDIESPTVTVAELFFQAGGGGFSNDRAVRTTLEAGRNRILLAFSDPEFNGFVRLDPGQVPGDYTLRSLWLFSTAPAGLVTMPRPQDQLAAEFNRSNDVLFVAQTVEELGAIIPLKDATLTAQPNGLAVIATGTDPGFLLPDVQQDGPAIMRVALISPASATLKLFYLAGGHGEFSEANSISQSLVAGENTVFLELPLPGPIGRLRVDPAEAPGTYVLKGIELRRTNTSEP